MENGKRDTSIFFIRTKITIQLSSTDIFAFNSSCYSSLFMYEILNRYTFSMLKYSTPTDYSYYMSYCLFTTIFSLQSQKNKSLFECIDLTIECLLKQNKKSVTKGIFQKVETIGASWFSSVERVFTCWLKLIQATIASYNQICFKKTSEKKKRCKMSSLFNNLPRLHLSFVFFYFLTLANRSNLDKRNGELDILFNLF